MTSQEFVIWLKGFTEGVHEYNITPKQWDLLKEKLGQVIGDDNKFVETPGMFQVHPEKPYPGVPIGQGGWGTPNIHDLVNRYPSWGGAGTAGPPIDCLTTSTTVSSGSSGIMFTTGDSLDISRLPSGSWHYTTSGGPTWYSINKIENDSREK